MKNMIGILPENNGLRCINTKFAAITFQNVSSILEYLQAHGKLIKMECTLSRSLLTLLLLFLSCLAVRGEFRFASLQEIEMQEVCILAS